MQADGDRYVEIPNEQNLLLEEEDLVTLFKVMCSEAESASLRGILDVGLMGEVAALSINVRVKS